jgi:hypothetical protein
VQCDGTYFDLLVSVSDATLPDPHTYDMLIKNETSVLLQKDTMLFLQDEALIVAVHIHHALEASTLSVKLAPTTGVIRQLAAETESGEDIGEDAAMAMFEDILWTVAGVFFGSIACGVIGFCYLRYKRQVHAIASID